ncbi:MAG: ERCC4-like helicase/ Hef nuclease [Promethearchaeota archaeon]|nr:MAG: ERCC4-like helicase/ Hef nuclease [Candidatus Lokiarchaeota archaeon]
MTTQEDFISHPLIEQNLVVRRSYQETIFINCLNQNSLVVIPTGLGKTIIGLMMAVHRLTEFSNSKIIFLAPTKPLVNQHYSSFKELTVLEEESMKSITGTISPEDRKELWKALKIAFMTPQVLQNDIITHQYALDDVSLIIFDECHRAVGDYAYCFIAKQYIAHSKHPQILGLTASPGSTEEKINEIKQNLFIEHLEIRTEKDPDVKPYIHNVVQNWIKISLPEEFSEILKILKEKLKEHYKYLKKMELLNSYNIDSVTRKDLLRLNQVINRKITSALSDDEKYNLFYAKKVQANSIRLSHMLELLETQGINALNDYFDKNIEKIKRNKANKSLKELISDPDIHRLIKLTKKIQAQGIIHPKIEKLEEILSSQFTENPDSRVLVFAHYRDSVNNIVRIIKKNDKIRAHKFIGQASKGSDKGLTQKQQIEILEEFKIGTYNTLVGTSVAEEGLDIAECDLVIFYDVVPSAIRSIQRRGRTGRKKEGKIFVLMAQGTRDEGYYWAEKSKESNMRSTLRRMKKKEQTSANSNGQKDLFSYMQKDSKTPEKKDEHKNNNKSKDVHETAPEAQQGISKHSMEVQQIEGAEQIKILCDNRETASPIVRKLSLMGVTLQLAQLEVADYIISDRVGIERKSSQDFTDSIKDGRLFKELVDLAKNFERPILLLEGDPFDNPSMHENALYGAISSIILDLGISIYKTSNVVESAKFLYQLAKREQLEHKKPVKSRFKKAPLELSYLLEYIISGVPGVNTLRAKSLLNELKTLRNIFNSDIGDLMKVENIGKKIAQEIYKLSRFNYKNT